MMAASPEEIEEEMQKQEEARKAIDKKVTDLRSGLSEKAEADRQQLVTKLEELRSLCTGPPAEALGRAIEALAHIVDTPILTRKASEIMLHSLEAWLEQSSADLQTFMQDIKGTIDAFVGKYTDELDAQIRARKKEEEVLNQLSVYLSRYT